MPRSPPIHGDARSCPHCGAASGEPHSEWCPATRLDRATHEAEDAPPCPGCGAEVGQRHRAGCPAIEIPTTPPARMGWWRPTGAALFLFAGAVVNFCQLAFYGREPSRLSEAFAWGGIAILIAFYGWERRQ